MKCFSFFKEKHNARRGSSAPNLSERPNSSDIPERAVKSSGSVPSSSRSVPELYREKDHNLRSFSYSELKEATNGFNRMLKIGEGGFGSVYKGSIRPVNGEGDPIVVAIKKLNSNSMQQEFAPAKFVISTLMNCYWWDGATKENMATWLRYLSVLFLNWSIALLHIWLKKGHKQWLAEVQFLSIVDHHNLVKLLGYCCVDGERGIQRLLVYEFMPNRSLEDHLFSKISPPMPWMRRLQVILDAAQGLAYLHEGMEVQVIFRDFKCSNVLLSEDFKAKLSDFGLAREGPTGDKTHVSTGVVGTYGYAAPEYVGTGHLTLKSDIWSFGVVLYEILTGRRALERNRPTMEQKLLDWVKSYPADSKKFKLIIDPQLHNQYCLVAARKIGKMADCCLNKNAKDRPTMSQVVVCLKEAIRDSEAETLSRT